jgi:hypothetical protein
MQKLIHKLGVWTLLTGILLSGVPLQAASREAKQPAAKVAMASVTDELLALLPESDIVAVIDVQRAFAELLPLLKNISTAGIGKTATEVETFAKLAGVEPKQIQAAVVGVKMTETLSRGSGVLLLQGIEVDGTKLTDAVKAVGGELNTADHNGKPVYTLVLKRDQQGAATEQMQFALLGNKRIAIGDLPALKTVLAGNGKGNPAALGLALKETKATGLVRFAGNLPEGLRAMLASQGELFSQVAAVKAIFGSFDLNPDNSAVLAARLRTASTNDAGQLKESLNGLVMLGKAFLGGNDDPTMKLYGQLLDQVKVGVEARDVSLLLQLSKEFIDKLK